MGIVNAYDIGYNKCSCTTNFATAPDRLDIVRVSDAMVTLADYQSRQHTFSMPPSHHRATLLLRPEDVGSVGGYYVGYDECSCTTNFTTAPGCIYNAQVF